MAKQNNVQQVTFGGQFSLVKLCFPFNRSDKVPKKVMEAEKKQNLVFFKRNINNVCQEQQFVNMVQDGNRA